MHSLDPLGEFDEWLDILDPSAGLGDEAWSDLLIDGIEALRQASPPGAVGPTRAAPAQPALALLPSVPPAVLGCCGPRLPAQPADMQPAPAQSDGGVEGWLEGWKRLAEAQGCAAGGPPATLQPAQRHQAQHVPPRPANGGCAQVLAALHRVDWSPSPFSAEPSPASCLDEELPSCTSLPDAAALPCSEADPAGLATSPLRTISSTTSGSYMSCLSSFTQAGSFDFDASGAPSPGRPLRCGVPPQPLPGKSSGSAGAAAGAGTGGSSGMKRKSASVGEDLELLDLFDRADHLPTSRAARMERCLSQPARRPPPAPAPAPAAGKSRGMSRHYSFGAIPSSSSFGGPLSAAAAPPPPPRQQPSGSGSAATWHCMEAAKFVF